MISVYVCIPPPLLLSLSLTSHFVSASYNNPMPSQLKALAALEEQEEEERNQLEGGSDSGTLRCDPCGRRFSSTEALEAHFRFHTQCPHPGCSFQATRKVSHFFFHITACLLSRLLVLSHY
jgi:hypothetical protein